MNGHLAVVSQRPLDDHQQHDGRESTVSLRLPADGPARLNELRSWLDRWFQRLRWPDWARTDVILALNEVCTNAIQHAYRRTRPGDVEVTATLRSNELARYLVVTVRDWGRWHEPAPIVAGRGRGLLVAYRCLSRLDIRCEPIGSTVIMVSNPVPARPEP